MKMRQLFYSGKDHQSIFPLKLSCGALILMIFLVGLANPSMSQCDSDLSVQTIGDFFFRISLLTSTSVRLKWFIPKALDKFQPNYYCIVYNFKKEDDKGDVHYSKTGSYPEFEIMNLTSNVFYEIYVKPCVGNNCFCKSQKVTVHT